MDTQNRISHLPCRGTDPDTALLALVENHWRELRQHSHIPALKM